MFYHKLHWGPQWGGAELLLGAPPEPPPLLNRPWLTNVTCVQCREINSTDKKLVTILAKNCHGWLDRRGNQPSKMCCRSVQGVFRGDMRIFEPSFFLYRYLKHLTNFESAENVRSSNVVEFEFRSSSHLYWLYAIYDLWFSIYESRCPVRQTDRQGVRQTGVINAHHWPEVEHVTSRSCV